MRNAFLILFISVFQAYSLDSYSQNTKLNLNMYRVPLASVLEKIEDSSGFLFLYNAKLIDVEREVSITAENKEISDILSTLFAGTSVNYKIIDRRIILSPGSTISSESNQQQLKISGRVSDSSGFPLPGVTVVVKGTTHGIITDIDGNYSLANIPGDAILIFSFVGMKTQEISVTGKTSINVRMEEETIGLEEVVAIGYGSRKRIDLTGSVASIKPDIMNRQPSNSFEKLMQGRAAGIQVITNDDPGSGATVRIRGGSSIYSSNTPLLVVDGFPIGDAGNLKQISPSDIESIDILKDASASAIYGSRGANGVIIVKTKQAKTGKTTVEISHQTTISQFASNFDEFESPLLQAQLSNEARINAGMTPLYIGREDASGIYYPSLSEIETGAWPYWTDWSSLVFRQNPVINNTNVTIRSGNEKTHFKLSLGYLNNPGISIRDLYRKGNLNFTLSHKIGKNLTIEFNDIISRDYRYNNKMWLRNKMFPVYDESGEYYLLNDLDYSHPLAIADKSYNYTNGFDNVSMLKIDLTVFEWLKLSGRAYYKYGNGVTDTYEPPIYTFNGDNRNGYGTITNNTAQEFTTEDYLTINKKWGIHALDLMGGYTYSSYQGRSSELTAQDFVNTALGNENLESGNPEEQRVSNSLSRSELVSFMFRVNYSLKDRYLLTFTSRGDGSTKFGDNNKWAFFPSGAISWKLQEEEFIKKLKIFNELKLRASYGVSGNQGINPYQTLPRYGIGLYHYQGAWANAIGQGYIVGYGGIGGYRLIWGGLGNPDLRWETTAQSDIGLDMGAFDDRVRITFDYYQKRTDNLLQDGFVPPSSSFDLVRVNDGSVLNKGIEFTLASDIVRKPDWDISATAIFTRNRNEVISLGEEERIGLITDNITGMKFQYWGTSPAQFFDTGVNLLAIGEPVNVFYGYRVDGIIQTEAEGLEAGLTGDFAKPGEFKYVDLDNNGIVDGNDKTLIGDPNPDFIASLNLNFRYKNFDAEIFLNGSYGGDILNTNAFGTAQTMPLRWTIDNPNNQYPSLRTSRYSYNFSDWWLQDGSYLRLQNLNIGYNLNLGNRINFISKIRLYFNATNLWTITGFKGYDPEVGLNGIYSGGLPRQRQFTFGTSIQF
jgi:TonB-linked SusC/RagA family outer membrane protein